MAQGRCSAMLAVALVLVSAAAVVQGATYTVGDDLGWHIPATATYYEEWAANKTFAVGDMLLFVYNRAGHNVLTVSATDYTSCTLTSTNLVQTGNDSLTLVAGANNYVCGFPGHCLQNQKLSVTTAAATAPTTAPTAAPAPPNASPPPPNAASAGSAATVFQVLAAVTVSLVALSP